MKKPLLTLSNADPLPLYDQVKRGIRAAVLQGDLEAGDPVPSFRNLAVELRISLITVKRAYDDLSAEGVLLARSGVGTFVAETAREACTEAARRMVEELMREAVGHARSIGMTRGEVEETLKRVAEDA